MADERDPVTREKLYTLSDIAKDSGFNPRTVRKHVEAGLLHVRRIGPHQRPRVPESERKRYLGLDDNGGK